MLVFIVIRKNQPPALARGRAGGGAAAPSVILTKLCVSLPVN